MAGVTLKFPSYFPKGCPPEDATDEEMLLFRMCKGPVPTAEDFLTFFQIDPEKYKGHILAYGLSVFKSEDDCQRARKKSPRLRTQYKYCASGTTNKDRGKILATPTKVNPHHITWWVYEGVEPSTFFMSCGGGGEQNE